MAGHPHTRHGFDSHYARDPQRVEAAIDAMDRLVAQFYIYLDTTESLIQALPEYALSVLQAHEYGEVPGDREMRSLKMKLMSLQQSQLR